MMRLSFTTTSRERVLLGVVIVLAIVCIGLVIGIASRNSDDSSSGTKSGRSSETSSFSSKLTQETHTTISDLFKLLVSDEEQTEDDHGNSLPVSEHNLISHQKNITRNVHVAGTDENHKVADYIHSMWKSQGLDTVEFAEYDVLLSYPDYDKPNTVELKDAAGTTQLLSSGRGFADDLEDEGSQLATSDKRAAVWWNAYSATGSVTSTLVYANLCAAGDFLLLEQKNISIADKLVICRYGGGWRGAKVYEAEKRGAVGLIIFSDSAGFNNLSETYPKGIRMPTGGAQRGTIQKAMSGDPLTPLYPAKDYTYRWHTPESARAKENDYALPAIPVTPIGYADALKILESMDGTLEAPEDWSKPMTPNITVRLSSTEAAGKFTLNVNTKDQKAKIRNVIGTIRGHEDPDKFVILGNHFDAWAYGAMDPNSGTITMLEITRLLTEAMKQKKWRPRRSIVFAAWDAEEYAVVGSTEWLEEHLKHISRNAVALINLDTAVTGSETFFVNAAPVLYRTYVNAAAKVVNPNIAKRPQHATVLDDWLQCPGRTLPNDPTVPQTGAPRGGSDDHMFLALAGVPTGWASYKPSCDPSVHYELYHTMFDTSYLVSQFVDKDHFKAHRALSHLIAEVLIDVSDNIVIPFNVTDYAVMLETWLNRDLVRQLVDSEAHRVIDDYHMVTSGLQEAAQRFLDAAKTFQTKVDAANAADGAVKINNPVLVNVLNNRLIALERCFIQEGSSQFLQNEKHVVFSVSRSNRYAASSFNGVLDSYTDYQNSLNSGDQEKAEFYKKMTNLQLTALRWSIESAIATLDLSGLQLVE